MASLAASKPVFRLSFFHNLIDNNTGVKAGVGGDLHEGLPESVLDDIDSLLLVLVGRRQGVKDWEATQQSNTTAGNNALLNSGPGGVQGVGDPVLLLVHLDLRGAADLEDSHTTGKPGHPLLDLLLLVLGVRPPSSTA